MYETYRDKSLKQPRSQSIKAFEHVGDLVSKGVLDPVGLFNVYVAQENRKCSEFLADTARVWRLA